MAINLDPYDLNSQESYDEAIKKVGSKIIE